MTRNQIFHRFSEQKGEQTKKKSRIELSPWWWRTKRSRRIWNEILLSVTCMKAQLNKRTGRREWHEHRLLNIGLTFDLRLRRLKDQDLNIFLFISIELAWPAHPNYPALLRIPHPLVIATRLLVPFFGKIWMLFIAYPQMKMNKSINNSSWKEIIAHQKNETLLSGSILFIFFSKNSIMSGCIGKSYFQGTQSAERSTETRDKNYSLMNLLPLRVVGLCSIEKYVFHYD
jgi:hypothetical protein